MGFHLLIVQPTLEHGWEQPSSSMPFDPLKESDCFAFHKTDRCSLKERLDDDRACIVISSSTNTLMQQECSQANKRLVNDCSYLHLTDRNQGEKTLHC